MKTTQDATNNKPNFSFGTATKNKERADAPVPTRSNGSRLIFGVSKETNTKSEGFSAATARLDAATVVTGFANSTSAKKINSNDVPAPTETNFAFGNGTTKSQQPISTSRNNAASLIKSNSDSGTTGTSAVAACIAFCQ